MFIGKLTLTVFGICQIVIPCAKEVRMEKEVAIAEGLVVKVSEAVQIRKTSPAEDFDFLRFVFRDEVILSAYVGNAPSFPTEKCRGEAKDTMLGGFRAREMVCVRDAGGGGYSRELLVDLGVPRGWPRFVHFMQSLNAQPVGDAIVKSLNRQNGGGSH